PRSRFFQSAQFFVTPGQGLTNSDSVERRTGLGQLCVVGEGLCEIAAGFRFDRFDEIGHTPGKVPGIDEADSIREILPPASLGNGDLLSRSLRRASARALGRP